MAQPSPRLPIVLAVLALAGCGAPSDGAPVARKARVAKVGVLAAPTRPLGFAVEAIGTLEALQVVPIPARTSGVVEELAFDEGRPVEPGTVMAVVDGTRRDLLLAQAELAVRRSEAAAVRAATVVERSLAQEAAAQAGLAETEGMLARRVAARARAPGVLPEEEVEAVRAQVARYAAQVDEALAAAAEARAAAKEADAALAEARGRLAIATKDADDARVHPPLAGIVERRHVVRGQWVREGDPIATLVDASTLRLRFRVPEAESTALEPGRTEVVFRTAALPGRELAADLVSIQGTADPVTRMVECLAEVRDPDPALKPGFFASVTARVARTAASVVVPEEAVLATEGGLVVHRVEDGRAHRVGVRLGLRTEDGWVEVLGGLDAGTTVVVENTSVLDEGLPAETFPSARATPPATGEENR